MKKRHFTNHKYLWILIIFFALSNIANAQRWNSRRYEFHLGLGASNFMGDICAPDPKYHNEYVWVSLFNNTGIVVDAHLKYALSQRSSVGAGLYLGTISAKDPINNQKYYYHQAIIDGQSSDGLQFKSFFTEISARYEFLVLKERRKSTVYRRLGQTGLKNLTFPSYLFIGVGGMVNYGKFSRNIDDGRSRVSDNFFNVAPVLPIGFGTKMRIDYNLYLNLEAGWRFTFSDGIDNAKGKENIAFGKWYDQYQFITLNLVYKLRAKRNKMPNFRF